MRKLAFLALVTLLAACGGSGSNDPVINDPTNPPDNDTGNDNPPAASQRTNWIPYTSPDGTHVVNRDGTQNVLLTTYITQHAYHVFGFDYDPIARRADNFHRAALVYFDQDRFQRIDLTTADAPTPVQVSSLTEAAEPCSFITRKDYLGVRLPGSNGNCSDPDARSLIIEPGMTATTAPYAGKLVANVENENAETIRILAINASDQLVALAPDFGNETILGTPLTASDIGSQANRVALLIDNEVMIYAADTNRLSGPWQSLQAGETISHAISDNLGNIYYFIGPALYRLNLTSPSPATLINGNAGPAEILHHYNGKLYALGGNAGSYTDLRSINTSDGTLSILYAANGHSLSSCTWSGGQHILQEINLFNQTSKVVSIDDNSASTLLDNATGLHFPYFAIGAMEFLTGPTTPTINHLRAYTMSNLNLYTRIDLQAGAWNMALFSMGSDTEFIGTLETTTGNAIVRFTYGDPNSLEFLVNTPDTEKRLLAF